MEQMFAHNWATVHLGLIVSLTLAQMLIVYVLSDSSNPPAGLGLYTVFFMTALIGWITVTLRHSIDAPLAVDLPSVSALINTYILFTAAGQRLGVQRGRIGLGLICLAATLSGFFLARPTVLYVHGAAAGLFMAGAGILCALRSVRSRNIGDAIIAYAAALALVGLPIAIYLATGRDDGALAQTVIIGVCSWSYALITVGFLASVAIEYQQQLSHMATADPLTRLLNRRGLDDALHVSFARAARYGHPTAAIVANIDHFKKINANFSHDTGDQVIRSIAAALRQVCRASDVVARTRGEAFLLILPETELDAARILAERIRSTIASQPLQVDGQRIAVTLSLGVASCEGHVELDSLIQEAGRAMNLAKQGGRNRVESVKRKAVRISNKASRP